MPPIPASLLALLALLMGLGHAAAAPNIVVIYADDLGYGDLGCQNPDSKIPTPNLDRLASQGLRFTDAHSSSGVCTPSRYALLQGRYHWRKFHGIVNSFDAPVLDRDRATLPQALGAVGYRTACIGKWHLGWDWDAVKRPGAKPGKNGYAPEAFWWDRPVPGGPLAFGFDHYFGDDVPNFPPYAWIEDDRLTQAPSQAYEPNPMPAEGAPEGRPGPMVEGWRQDQVMPEITRRAARWIRQQAGGEKPFFLYFALTAPHAPILPTNDWRGTSAAGPYGDYVAQSDGAVGEVLRALDAIGAADNTLVIFTSDNGPETYAYARARDHAHRSAGPLRGLKRDLWEGGHRVPMIVRWPGEVAPGSVSDALMSQIDLFATLAAIVGYNIPAGVAEDSVNQLALLRGDGPGARDALVHNTNPKGYAIRRGDWVLIDAPSGGVSRVPPWHAQAEGLPSTTGPELFNLRSDLGQRNNLVNQRPEQAAELRRLLQSIRAQPGG